MRTRLIAMFGLALCIAGCASPGPRHIIDTHIHLYDTSRPGGVPWPPKEETTIYRPVLPNEYRRVARQSGVTGTLVVEASPIIADNDWVLSATENDELFIGLVASLKPDAPDFEQQLDRLCQDPRFVGIRPRLNQPDSPLEPAYLQGLAMLAERGKTLDLLAHTFPLDDIAEVGKRVPNLRIVVNHLAGIHANGQALPEELIAKIDRLAKQPNIYCKMSGIFQQSKSRPAPIDPAHYKPAFDAVWNAFGEDRITYGSNWPVTNVAGEYATQFDIIYEYVKAKGRPALDKVFWLNANRVYGLGLE